MPENTTTLNEWDPMAGRIYKDNVGANAFVTASTVALLGTPHSEYSEEAISDAKVIGLIQDWNISQTKQSPQLFECGSNGKYTLSTGRVAGSMNMSRVIYQGSNLLFLLYAGRADVGQIDYGGTEGKLKDIAGYTDGEDAAAQVGFAINLASSVFLKPLGIIIVMNSAQKNKDGNKRIASFFLENAYINSHGMGASAGAPYVGEQVSLTFEGVYPVSSSLGDVQWPSSS